MTPFWAGLSLWSHLVAGIACAVLAVLFARARTDAALRWSGVAALILTAAWCVLAAAFSPLSAWAQFAETARNLGWLVVLWRMFVRDGRYAVVVQIRVMLIALLLIESLQPLLIYSSIRAGGGAIMRMLVLETEISLRMLVIIGALVLVHNLYVGASSATRAALRWPGAALGMMWGYDLNFYTIGSLGDGLSPELGAMRGVAMLAMTAPLALSLGHSGPALRFLPSRTVAFRSLSLLVIGGYLLLMVAVAQSIALIGGDVARLTQIGFVFAASVLAFLWLPSVHMRRWLRVTALKHLFEHRYDYREEWLRLTRTIGRAGPDALPLQERAIQALADITDSPGGVLLGRAPDGQLSLTAHWRWSTLDVPAPALDGEVVQFFERESYILNLDDLRKGKDARAARLPLPGWLRDEPNAWVLVPLLHFGRLAGLVLLSRPPVGRSLDWEDLDLLRVAGQQLASYLAEQAGQEALSEAARFEEFHRRIAFVMHDIKNLASQLSLLARNAERHADNPAFRADMLITLRNSADKLNGLLARLGRYGAPGKERMERLALDECVTALCARYAATHPVMVIEARPCFVRADREALDQALAHLVQNGIEASAEDSPVFLRVSSDGMHGVVEITDSGIGMSPEFIRTRLFKPFVSSKSAGFGIGAFEARELIHAMHGRLDVESREGLGTRFFVRLPLANVAELTDGIIPGKAEVA